MMPPTLPSAHGRVAFFHARRKKFLFYPFSGTGNRDWVTREALGQ
jgi:hypothetical protein